MWGHMSTASYRSSWRAHLTKDAPPRRPRFHRAAPMAEPARMAADTAATSAMAQRGKVFGTAKASEDGSPVPAEAALPDAPNGAAAEAGPTAGPALRARGSISSPGIIPLPADTTVEPTAVSLAVIRRSTGCAATMLSLLQLAHPVWEVQPLSVEKRTTMQWVVRFGSARRSDSSRWARAHASWPPEGWIWARTPSVVALQVAPVNPVPLQSQVYAAVLKPRRHRPPFAHAGRHPVAGAGCGAALTPGPAAGLQRQSHATTSAAWEESPGACSLHRAPTWKCE